MPAHPESLRQEIIDKVREQLKNRLPAKENALLEIFIQRYYTSCALTDLIERSIETLAGIVFSHWKFIYQRQPGQAKVRIFNPTLDNDGWTSPHTIIEISHDDIPFLVDSTRMEINKNFLQTHFAIHFGGLKVIRDQHNQIIRILPLGATEANESTEAPIYFEIDRQTDPVVMETLQHNIENILAEVRIVVTDWRKMVNRVKECLQDLEENPPPLDPDEVSESKDFLEWLINNHFTFLGCRDYKLIGNEKGRALQVIPGTGLGVLHEATASIMSRSYADLPPQARKLALSKSILIITKTNTKSTVHRSAYTDYIGVKRFNNKGELIGERRFLGLYTSTAYHSSPRHIPFLRHKVAKVIQEFHYPPDSHNGKEIVNILETLPRDDLFQATPEDLVELTTGILHLQERKRIRLFIRKDPYDRYFSCLVYVPRDIFNTELCMMMETILMQSLQGKEATSTNYFSDSALARIHFLIRVSQKNHIEYDVESIQRKLIAAARSWSDELKTYLIEAFGEAAGLKYFNKYQKAFPASYMEYYLPSTAIDDIRKIETLTPDNPLAMTFYKSGNALRLKLFHSEHTIALSDVLPTLEHMGMRIIGERPHEIIFKDGSIVWVNDFDMVYLKNKEIEIEEIKDIFQDAFSNIWFRQAEDDGFNSLVLAARLTWRETAVLRAYTKYLRQIGFTFSQSYVEQALINNAEIAKNLVDLFKLRFAPETFAEYQLSITSDTFAVQIEQSFEQVQSLDEDRILRRLLEVILATTRTNYFQNTENNKPKYHISFKFNPALISDLPLPKPMFEIFVYSPRVEGVHLRGGKVARGGIRWSDRREDFRTEILGLMKAQQVKNSVIVPVGAKGGFFPKMLPVDAERDVIMKEVIFSYSTFIRGLLDLTDNIQNNTIVYPKDVVRYDEEDPYLVVAADKGTATFSDIANAIAKEYHFWLDDAFASGGSAGYDHKKMGITARGAWESVKRHFREVGIDFVNSDFTVVGIGDLSGDVFGNGMLMSEHIKLVAAFNHVHIFLDPNPDAKTSFEERKRLFNLPRSAWTDYNPKLISEGGGVFDRKAKSIKISPEIKKVLNIKKDSLIPNELIKAILTAPVDLIFNGGIGTFVKASYETHLDVGDRSNDAIRVDGNELTARVVAEGGNLGLTQLGRIEYSLNSGICYTDFIDNSAGVDCSDHEVNIKILLNKIVAEGTITLAQRNKLLEKMTDDVAQLVLRDNYEQTQMLSLEASVATTTMDLFIRYINELEKSGRLKRKLEFLPDEKNLLERKANGQGLTRPELAVLLAYCKMFLKQDILETDLPEDPHYIKHLKTAFPTILCKKFLPQIKEHSLRREIISTQLGKSITDRMGINFIERLQRETGAHLGTIIRAFTIAQTIFNLESIWHQIEELDYKVVPAVQQKMMLQIYYLIRRATRWFIRNRKPDIDIEKNISDFQEPIQELIGQFPKILTEEEKSYLNTEVKDYLEKNVPADLANQIAISMILFTSLDIVEGARKYNFKISEVAEVYYFLGSYLELSWLREQMGHFSVENQWEELARSGFRDDLDRVQRRLSVSILSYKSKKVIAKSIEDKITIWLQQHKFLIERWLNLLADMKASTVVDFVTYSVVLRELTDFAQAGK